MKMFKSCSEGGVFLFQAISIKVNYLSIENENNCANDAVIFNCLRNLVRTSVFCAFAFSSLHLSFYQGRYTTVTGVSELLGPRPTRSPCELVWDWDFVFLFGHFRGRNFRHTAKSCVDQNSKGPASHTWSTPWQLVSSQITISLIMASVFLSHF